jgi:acetyl esterase/lipase
VKCLAGRLRERAAEFGIDAERVAYLGRSAGGAIAIVAAYSATDPRIPPACDVQDRPVSAMVSVYGPLDLEWGWRQRPFPDPIVGYKVLERYIGGTPADLPEAYRLASAVSWVGPATPPTLLIHGTRDSLVSPHHVELLTAMFLRKGLAAPRQLLVPFADHGFDYHPGGLGEQLARTEILEFLGSVLGR